MRLLRVRAQHAILMLKNTRHWCSRPTATLLKWHPGLVAPSAAFYHTSARPHCARHPVLFIYRARLRRTVLVQVHPYLVRKLLNFSGTSCPAIRSLRIYDVSYTVRSADSYDHEERQPPLFLNSESANTLFAPFPDN